MYATVNGVRLYFDVDGEALAVDGARMRAKPTLVLLHGGPGADHSYFKPAFGRLRDVAQLVYLDHRANGRSERGATDHWHLAQWGDDVRAFCDALGIERPIVLGVSFGGIVALAYATRHPGHARALVLSSTQATVTLPRVLAAFERLGGPRARDAAERFWTAPDAEALADYARHCWPCYARAPRDPDVLARQVVHPEVLMHYGAREDGRFDYRDALARIACPALVLGGEEDPITPIADAEDLAAGIPGARLVRFPGCGHGIFQDAPDAYFAAVRAFVEEVGGDA
ncbi:MAG: alpha/beta fold hydrolase [Myxococcota bacterium]